MNDYERIARVIRHIDGSFTNQPDLAELAEVAGLSPHHFHRMFVKWAGVTPKDFVRALTIGLATRLLREGSNVLDASYDSGLSGPSRLHDLCVSLVAASPGEIGSGGAGLEIRWGVSDSPFGNIFLARSPRGLTHISFFDGDEAESLEVLQGDWPNASLIREDLMAQKTAGDIFSAETTSQSDPLRLHVKGTPFQLKVWQALLNIPEGGLSTYGKLAGEIGLEGGSRAVGNAVGANRISYLIPCHRVIRATGATGGYRWGQERKRAMLSWEQAKTFTPP